jgi:di/tricarboxylate transporter
VSDATIVLIILTVTLLLFVWNRLPPVLVGMAMALSLYFTGVLPAADAIRGLGDPVVVMLAGLFVVAAGLDAAGVTTWAGQKLLEGAGGSVSRAYLLLMLVCALFCGVLGFIATVAALLPVATVLAIRLKLPSSQIMMPLAFAAHGASAFTLLGTPVNVIALYAARGAGLDIGFFEFAAVGLPLFLGTVAIILLTRRFLLPQRNGATMPADFSAHAAMLVREYGLEDGLHRLGIGAGSPLVGRPRDAIAIDRHPELSLVAVKDGRTGGPLTRDALQERDMVLVRGPAAAADRFAQALGLAPGGDGAEPEALASALFNRGSGLAEVVIPPRSDYIGQTAFNGMATASGDLMVLGIRRGGEELGGAPVALRAGDTLLLQGAWQALDKRLATPELLVVDSPDLVRRQAVPLGWKAAEAIGVLCLLIGLLVWGAFPPAINALLCAGLMVALGVVTLPQAYRGIDWNTVVLIGAMIPIAPAMERSGVAAMIGGGLVDIVGDLGPLAVLAGLFVVTAALTQLMANTAAALVMLPVALAAAADIGVAPLAMIVAVVVGAQAAFLSPVGTPPNLMVMAPGGYAFIDYAKFGAPILLWWCVATIIFVPLRWGLAPVG